MIRFSLCMIFILIVNCAFSQTIYKDSIFANVNMATYTYRTSNNQELQFDFYKAKGVGRKAPLLVYVHGGGFSSGIRDEETIVKFATNLAYRGYAVASVSYRLTMKKLGFGCNVEASKKIAAIDSASEDISHAVKYIIDNPSSFDIDENKIIISGTSAGAETVLNMVYVYQDTILPSNFKYAGVIGMAGAITTLDSINFNTSIPTQLFHGTADRLVPYRHAAHHYCDPKEVGYLMLYGSQAIATRLHGLETSYYLYTVEGGSHDWSWLPLTEGFEDIIDFLYYDVILQKPKRQTTRIVYDKS